MTEHLYQLIDKEYTTPSYCIADSVDVDVLEPNSYVNSSVLLNSEDFAKLQKLGHCVAQHFNQIGI